MHVFDHEKMDVFRVSIEFVALVEQIIPSFPKGKEYLVDQLRRASASVVLNIAEGAGEFSPDEKSRFYRMAKRSATECAGIFAICQVLKLTSGDTDSQGRQQLLRIVAMLTKMVKNASGILASGTHAGTGSGSIRVSGKE